MRKVRLLLPLLGGLVALCWAMTLAVGQAWNPQGSRPAPPEFRTPQYVLVLRHYSAICTIPTEISANFQTCGGWTTSAELFSSLPALVERLNWSQYTPDEVVGVWRLNDASHVRLSQKLEEKVIPAHTEERRWTERVWKIE